jgi:hypothetical protein
MAPAPREPSLPDEILEDIFLRLTTPADLACAAAVCASFRRVASGRRFLRRFLPPRLHPPPLLGFLEHRGRGGFHQAEPPYGSAPAARAVAQAVDFSFSFLPSPAGGWRVCDARDGRVLLSRSVSSSSAAFADLAACDPLHRRYVQIPRIPGHLLSSSFAPYRDDAVEFEPFLAPDDPGEDKDEPSFQVICSVRSWYSAVIFVFSSVTGIWSRVTSISFPPRRAIKDPKVLVRYYACGCFFWVNGWDGYMLVLDPRDDDVKLSLVELPRILVTRHQGLAIVDAGEDRVCVIAIDYWRHTLALHCRTWRNNGFGPEKWQHKIVPLPEPEYYWYIKGAADGYLLLKAFPRDSSQQPEALYFTLELKTMLIERLCVSDHHICHAYLYASFPPPLSPPSI